MINQKLLSGICELYYIAFSQRDSADLTSSFNKLEHNIDKT